jgi:hypothetical protein
MRIWAGFIWLRIAQRIKQYKSAGYRDVGRLKRRREDSF